MNHSLEVTIVDPRFSGYVEHPWFLSPPLRLRPVYLLDRRALTGDC